MDPPAEHGPIGEPPHKLPRRRPHVVILVENLPVPLDRRVWQEAQALRLAGWAVTVIGPRGAGEMRQFRDTIDGISVRRYPQWPAGRLRGYILEYLPSLLFTFALLAWARLRGPVDVIHGCNPPDFFWLLGRVGRLWGAQFVYDQHDANPELSRTKFGERSAIGRLLFRLTRWLEQRSYETAALVIAPNDSYAQIARTRGGVPEEKLILVRNAPDVGWYRELAEGVDRNEHGVGYIGVMGSQDGLDLLLSAWREVLATPGLADARLELIGDGEARPALEQQSRRLLIDHSVTFHGYLAPAQFVPILARCAVCVSPDPPTPFNNVSTMVKVVDYIAAGRGVVSYDLAETRRVAGDAAVIVPDATPSALGIAVANVLLDVGRRASLEEAAARRPEEIALDWSQSANRLRAAYHKLAIGTPRSGSRDGTVTRSSLR